MIVVNVCGVDWHDTEFGSEYRTQLLLKHVTVKPLMFHITWQHWVLYNIQCSHISIISLMEKKVGSVHSLECSSYIFESPSLWSLSS